MESGPASRPSRERCREHHEQHHPKFTLTDAIAHCLDVHRVRGEERSYEPGNLEGQQSPHEPEDKEAAGDVQQHVGEMKEVRTSLAERPLQRETDGGDGTVERGTANVLPRRPIGMGEEFSRGGEGMNSIVAQDGMDVVVREAIAEAGDRSRKRNQGDSQPWSEAEPLRLASFGWHRGSGSITLLWCMILNFNWLAARGKRARERHEWCFVKRPCYLDLRTGIRRKPSASCGAAKAPWAAPPGAMQQ